MAAETVAVTAARSCAVRHSCARKQNTLCSAVVHTENCSPSTVAACYMFIYSKKKLQKNKIKFPAALNPTWEAVENGSRPRQSPSRTKAKACSPSMYRNARAAASPRSDMTEVAQARQTLATASPAPWAAPSAGPTRGTRKQVTCGGRAAVRAWWVASESRPIQSASDGRTHAVRFACLLYTHITETSKPAGFDGVVHACSRKA